MTVAKQKRRAKPVTEMNSDELAGATKELDEEFAADSFGEPTARQKAQLRRAKRKRGRPKLGKGVRVISVSVEKDLLARTDRLAKRLGVKRAWLISRGLAAILDEEVATET